MTALENVEQGLQKHGPYEDSKRQNWTISKVGKLISLAQCCQEVIEHLHAEI